MDVNSLRFLYEYNYWARDRILRQVEKLSPAQFLAASDYSRGSVRDTLVHVLSAEWVWRVRCQEGISPPALLDAGEFATCAALTERWRSEETRMRAYLADLTDAALPGVIHYRRTGGETQQDVLWHLLVHVVNHGTEHRSVLAERLTGYGFSPGDLDLIHFVRVAKGG